jgi:hypothetical protein
MMLYLFLALPAILLKSSDLAGHDEAEGLGSDLVDGKLLVVERKQPGFVCVGGASVSGRSVVEHKEAARVAASTSVRDEGTIH